MSANIKPWEQRKEEYYSQSCFILMRSDNFFKDAEIADLRAALAAKAVPDGWQPIETAPKDGTYILVVMYGYTPAVACWRANQWMTAEMESDFEDGELEEAEWEVTHWMHLPDLPSPAQQKG